MNTPVFNGFGRQAQNFFAEISAHNDRTWFQENRSRYEKYVLDPADAFVSALGPRLEDIFPDIRYGIQRNGSGSIMRIYRDLRFSPDKRPYKDNLGIIFWIGEGKKVELPCFYFHLDARQAFFYGGRHIFPKDALERYRAALDDRKQGEEIEAILSNLERKGLPLMEEPAWKRVPQPYPPDHPRALLLLLSGIGVGKEAGPAELETPGLIDICARAASEMEPLLTWLRRIGP